MWLAKDERRLLAGYYRSIGAVDTEKQYHLGHLAPLLRFPCHRPSVPEYGRAERCNRAGDSLESIKREIVCEIDARARITEANGLLAARGLIACTAQQGEIDVVRIRLSVKGYDLGRRYSHWFARTGLWFDEYRNHWIWLILAFFGGALGNRLLEWIGLLGNG
jgi:hypothetical protein